MTEYDSILKEKKKYEEPVKLGAKRKKHFPYLTLDFIFIVVILGISYLVYYRTVLAPDKIFALNISRMMNDYKTVFRYLPLEELNEDFYFEGTISMDNEEYNYGIIRNQNKIKIDFSVQDNYLLYYLDDDAQYIKLSSFGDNYIGLGQTSLNDVSMIKEKASTYITEDKFIKKFYFDGYIPVVEVNLVLKNEDIRGIIPFNLREQYEVLLTFKNNAFTNEIINMKVTINNLTTNERELITYRNGEFTYSDGEKLNLKFALKCINEDFNLKIYSDEVLYSVLSGTKQEEQYEYMYQVIDQIYNISLGITEEDNGYTYEVDSNIEHGDVTATKKIVVTLRRNDNIILSDNIDGVRNFNSLTKDEKKAYKKAFDDVIGNLRQLIDEYK